MAGCLIFYFASNMNLALDHANLYGSSIIKCGSSFDLFKVMTNNTTLCIVLIKEVPMGSKLIL